MNKLMASSVIGFVISVAGQVAAAAGVYVGVDGGNTHYAAGAPSKAWYFQPGQEFSGSDSTYDVHLGYQMAPWFSLELAYNDYGSVSDSFRLLGSVDFIAEPNDTQTMKVHGVSLNGVIAYEFTPSLSVFGNLGMSTLRFKNTLSGGLIPVEGSVLKQQSSRDQALVYGAGLKYRLTDSMAARLGINRTETGNVALTTTSLGVDYTF